MKRLWYLFIITILFIGMKSVNAFQSFDNSIKVYDYAQVLTEKEENKLKTEVNKYIDKYNIDMVIVTVKYYTQSNLDEYINLFYNQNKFGIGSNKDGIFIVLDLKNNDIGIQTFGEATTFYSETEINSIHDVINQEKDYYDKLYKFIDSSNEYIDKFDSVYTTNNIFSSINWLSVIIPSIIIPTIIVVIGLLKNKKVKKEETYSYYIKKDSLVINKKEDKFITTNTKKERISK